MCIRDSNDFATKGVFSKSYRFTPPYSSGFKVIEEVGIENKCKVHDKTNKNDPICLQLAQNCRQLTIDLNALQSQSHDTKEEAGALATHLSLGSVNAQRGKRVRRIYHRVNTASKEVRKLLRFDGNPLLEYDLSLIHI